MGVPVPVRIRGVVYPSVNAAAAAVGVKPSTISAQLLRKGHAESAGLGMAAPGRNSIPRNRKPVTIHGTSFPTIKAAADALGLSYTALHQRLRRPMTPAASDDLMARVMAWDARNQRKAA